MAISPVHALMASSSSLDGDEPRSDCNALAAALVSGLSGWMGRSKALRSAATHARASFGSCTSVLIR